MISTQTPSALVTALEESETTGEPSDPSYATIATTIPTLFKTDAAVLSLKHVRYHTLQSRNHKHEP